MTFLPKDQGVTLFPSEKLFLPLGWKSRNPQPDSVQRETLELSVLYGVSLPSPFPYGTRMGRRYGEGAGRVWRQKGSMTPRKQHLPNTTELTYEVSECKTAQIQTRQIS